MVEQAKWFEREEALPREAKEFLEALRAEAEGWLDADPLASQVYDLEDGLVLGLDVGDRARKVGLRILRVDYGPSGLVYGEDATHQFDSNLTFKQHEYGTLDRGD